MEIKNHIENHITFSSSFLLSCTLCRRWRFPVMVSEVEVTAVDVIEAEVEADVEALVCDAAVVVAAAG